MAVTVNDVRIALNNITIEELADETIQQKIEDAIAQATEISEEGNDRYIRDLAAYQSFLVSRTYTKVKIGEIAVTRDLDAFIKALKKKVDEALEEGAMGERLVVVATPMWDNRPDDPYEPDPDV